MNIDVVVVAGALFLVILGMAVGLTVAEHGSRAREHRMARQQAELNAERLRLVVERERPAGDRG